MPDRYDPQKHHRRSIRLKDYDYTQPGAYFVTIVAWGRREIFGRIQAEEISLSPAGEIVWHVWEDLPRHFKNITLGSAVVMPNHFHGIIMIEGPERHNGRFVGRHHSELQVGERAEDFPGDGQDWFPRLAAQLLRTGGTQRG